MMGNLVVKLGLNSRGFTKGLDSAQQKLGMVSSSITRMGGKLIGLGAAAVAPFGFAVKAASDMEETMNKFNVVFGANAAIVKKWGDSFGAQVGRSKQQMADFLGSSQDLLVPMGFDAESATSMSKQITSLAVDLASFNNMADSDVLRDLHAALTGSGEVMKKYGVIVSQAAVNQRLLNMGLDPKRVTEAQKAQARMGIILEGTTAAQGDAIRSSNSWANQQKALGATINNVAASIGSVLLPIITPMLATFNTMVQDLGVFIEQNKQLVPVIAGGAVALVGLGAAFVTIGGAAALAGAAVTGFTAITTVAGAVVGAILSPVGLVTAAVVAAGGAFLYFSGIGGKAIEYIKSVFPGLGGSAKETFTGIQLGLVRMWEDFKHVFTGTLPAVFDWMSDNWRSTFDTLLDFTMTVFINLGKNIRGALKEIWAFIKSGGTQGLEFAWTPLTDGFHNSMKELKIPDRVKSDLEKSLEQSLSMATADRKAKEAQKKMGLDMKQEFKMPDMPKMSEMGAMKVGESAKGQGAEKEYSPVGAALRGSGEAVSAIIRSMNTAKNPQQKIQEKQLKVAERMEKHAKQTARHLRNIEKQKGAQIRGMAIG